MFYNLFDSKSKNFIQQEEDVLAEKFAHIFLNHPTIYNYLTF